MTLELVDLVWLILAGVGAGMLNAAAGAGTLITYPALLAIGLSPVVANATNSFGMTPGTLAAVFMYRGHLRGRREKLVKWAMATSIGAAAGAFLVILLPAEVFAVVVPWLILSVSAVVAIQPLITRWLKHRKLVKGITPAVALIGVYGGYFGGGQGIAYLAVLGSADEGEDIQRDNSTKNFLAAVANGTAAVVFLISGTVAIIPGIVVGVSAVFGGLVGGGVARRLPPLLLRIIVVMVGVCAVIAIWLMR